MAISSVAGHWRRTATVRTHGTLPSASRAEARSTVKNVPRNPCWITDAMYPESARAMEPVTTTRWIANAGRAAIHLIATVATAQNAAQASVPAMRLRSGASCQALCHMPRSAGPLERCEAQNRDTQVGERQSRLLRRHRHQAVAGHAGRCVQLEEREAAVGAQHQVGAAPAAAAEHAECAQRLGTDPGFEIGVDPRRTVVLRVVGEILVLVVVVALWGFDPHERQRLVAEHRSRDLN